ncbi:MAG TPA: response regulator transcription factor [Euzebyales bacterium]|nr:response regulator transcription factor [Euzebyales bacterium]
MSRILVVEDESRIASFLVKGLRAEGHAATVVDTGSGALSHARMHGADLVLLDLGLPDIDGLDVLVSLRRFDPRTPVLVLTARDEVADTVAALDAGADDYLSKPFAFEELLARIRVALRDDKSDGTTVLRCGDVELDLRARRVRRDGRSVELTAREFALAEVFFRHPGQVLSREQLLSNVWGYDYDPESNVVDVYVGYLRRKVGHDRIATVRGMGYRLTDPSLDE